MKAFASCDSLQHQLKNGLHTSIEISKLTLKNKL